MTHAARFGAFQIRGSTLAYLATCSGIVFAASPSLTLVDWFGYATVLTVAEILTSSDIRGPVFGG
jgi:hypothetical protein